jgi:hypothetical protein
MRKRSFTIIYPGFSNFFRRGLYSAARTKKNGPEASEALRLPPQMVSVCQHRKWHRDFRACEDIVQVHQILLLPREKTSETTFAHRPLPANVLAMCTCHVDEKASRACTCHAKRLTLPNLFRVLRNKYTARKTGTPRRRECTSAMAVSMGTVSCETSFET